MKFRIVQRGLKFCPEVKVFWWWKPLYYNYTLGGPLCFDDCQGAADAIEWYQRWADDFRPQQPIKSRVVWQSDRQVEWED